MKGERHLTELALRCSSMRCNALVDYSLYKYLLSNFFKTICLFSKYSGFKTRSFKGA